MYYIIIIYNKLKFYTHKIYTTLKIDKNIKYKIWYKHDKIIKEKKPPKEKFVFFFLCFYQSYLKIQLSLILIALQNM